MTDIGAERWPTVEETLATRLQRRRKQMGISQRKLASMVGCSQQVVLDYERGRVQSPGGDNLVKMARVLGVSSAWLLGKVESMERDDRLPDDWVEAVEEAMADGFSPSEVKRAIQMLKLALGRGEPPANS